MTTAYVASLVIFSHLYSTELPGFVYKDVYFRGCGGTVVFQAKLDFMTYQFRNIYLEFPPEILTIESAFSRKSTHFI